MYEKKKVLVEKAFDQAKKELKKENASKNYVAEYLSTHFESLFGSAKTEKMFERYYTYLVQKNENRYIDEITLDQLSKYIGYKNYEDFCNKANFTEVNQKSAFTTVNVSIDDKNGAEKDKPNFIINVTTNPIFRLQEFLTKQSGMGILGILLIGGILVGRQLFSSEEKNPEVSKSEQVVGVMDYSALTNDSTVYYEADIEKEKIPATQIVRVLENTMQKPMEKLEHYMYWNGERFVATAEANLGGQFEVFPMNELQFKYFKKITCPDTITIKSLKRVWYSKKDNLVEFFTADGKNPENDKELHPLTIYILNKYILSKN